MPCSMIAGRAIPLRAAPTSLCGVTTALLYFSNRPGRQLDQYAGVLDVVIDCNLKDRKALFDFQACRMCGLRCRKEPLRLLVNLEKITSKLGPAFLRNTHDDFFSSIAFMVLRKHFDLTPSHKSLLGFDKSIDDIVFATGIHLQHANGIDWR
jgi:hypothetical protein